MPMKASYYIQKLFVMFRHARVEILFWGIVMLPVMADDGSYANEFAVGGTLLFMVVIAVLYRVMRKQQKDNLLEIDQMNAEVLAGRIGIVVANLEDLVDGVSFRLQHDRQAVLQQFHALSSVKDVSWQEGMLALAESSALGKGNQNRIREAIGKVQQLLLLEPQVAQSHDGNPALLAEEMIALAGDAIRQFRKASDNLVTY